MVVEIIPAFKSITSAVDILKTLVGIRDANLINSKIAEVNALLITAQGGAIEMQSQNSALQEKIQELKEKVSKLEGWEKEKNRYSLTEIAPSKLVYTLKLEYCKDEPRHHLCPNCYNKGMKSILQMTVSNGEGYQRWECFECKFEIILGGAGYAYTPVGRNDYFSGF